MRMVMNFGQILNQLSKESASDLFDDFIKQPRLSIEEVLDNDREVLLQSKHRNPKLKSYFRAVKIEILIMYITTEPNPSQPKKVCFKYPFVASELIANHDISAKIAENPDLLGKLMKFLRQPKVSSPLTGYFSNAVQALITINGPKTISYIYEEQYVNDMFRHMYSPAIADLLECLLSSKAHLDYKYCLQMTTEGIVELVSGPTSWNASQLLLSLIAKQKEMHCWEDFMEFLVSENCTNTIFGRIHDKNAIAVMISIVKNTFLIRSLHCKVPELILTNIREIELMLQKSERNSIPTSFGKWIRPVGEQRLKLIELLTTCVKFSDEGFNNQLAESEVAEIITDVFFLHPWNSNLHTLYYQFVETVLDSDSEELKEKLFCLENLGVKLVGASRVENNIEKGFIGHIVKIGNLLIEKLPNFLIKVPGGTQFIHTVLGLHNNKDALILAGDKGIMEQMEEMTLRVPGENPRLIVDYQPEINVQIECSPSKTLKNGVESSEIESSINLY